jgi:hypothetical protein
MDSKRRKIRYHLCEFLGLKSLLAHHKLLVGYKWNWLAHILRWFLHSLPPSPPLQPQPQPHPLWVVWRINVVDWGFWDLPVRSFWGRRRSNLMWGLGSREIKPSFCLLLLLLLIKSHEVYTYEEAPPRLHLMEALPYYHCTIHWKLFMTWLWMNCNQVTKLSSILCKLSSTFLLVLPRSSIPPSWVVIRSITRSMNRSVLAGSWFFYKDFWVQV